MKIYRFLAFLFAVATFSPCLRAAGDTTDADGYPVMYVTGNFNKWKFDESAYRMERYGNTYTVSIPYLDGEFKISGDDWQYNFGSNNSIVTVSQPTILPAVRAGKNICADNLKNVQIYFDLSLSNPHTTDITFIVDGVKPEPKPVDGLSGTLPVLYINVYSTDDKGNFVLDINGNKVLDNEIINLNLNHKNYFSAEYWLDVNGCQWMIDEGAKSIGSQDEPLPTEIKARGNWTRTGFSKKPFKLKLGKKQNLLGLTPDKSKHYALLAHADDYYGYMRNFVGFNLGKRIGLPWTPSQQPVEVVINGDYRGLYFLTESIRVGDGRVPVAELKDEVTDPALASGGYIVELDNYDEENQIRIDEKWCAPGHYYDMLRVTFNTPEVYSELQYRFILDQFTAMNNLVGENSDDLWSYIDMDDLVRYYMVKEIISDAEAFHGSTYLFRDRGEGQKWHFTPLWDCGQAFNGSSQSYFYDGDSYGNTWIPSIRMNSKFNARLYDTWKWFMANRYDGIYDDIRSYANVISDAAKADAKRWKNQPVPNGGVSVVDNSDMPGRRDEVIHRLQEKTDWLSKKWGSYNGSFDEPARDTTPAALLPDYMQAGVESVTVDSSDADMPTEYFDLMGRRVALPQRGNFYIIRQGRNVTREIRF